MPMKRFATISLLLSSVLATTCRADEGLFWAAPHVADTGVSLVVLQAVEGVEELNPFGFPGVVVAKLAVEGFALSRRDAGDIETCQALAAGARWGGWIGTGATLGGLAGGPVGLAAGGLAAGLLSWKGSQRSALETCLQQPIIDPDPYSYSGPACLGWNDARPDFCNVGQ
jgi:hypothetical protein